MKNIMINYSKLKKNSIEVSKLLIVVLLGLVACFYVAESSAATECVIAGWVTESGGRPLQVVYTDSVYTAENCFEQANGFVTLSSAEYALLKQLEEQMNDVSIINAEDATIAFTFGMSGYLIFWFVGYKGRMARRAISFM